jgi:hypothetical protein
MHDILNDFQNAALAFNPITLAVPGLLCTLLGIIIWLSGTRFTRIVAIVAGFIGGGIGGFYLFPAHQTAGAISGAVIGALIAMAIHKFTVVIAGLAVFAVTVLAFLVGTHFSEKVASGQPNFGAVPVKLNQVQTLEQIKLRLQNVTDKLYSLSVRLPFNTWPAFGAGIVLVAVAAMLSGRLIVAFATSSLGVGLIFAGMLNLLLFKGSSPLTYVYDRISFFFPVFAAMAAAGTIVQMILCRPPKLKMVKDEKERLRELEEESRRK